MAEAAVAAIPHPVLGEDVAAWVVLRSDTTGSAESLRAFLLERLADYEATKPGRKLVVWISPGWPLLSDPEVGFTSKEQLGLFNSIVAFS